MRPELIHISKEGLRGISKNPQETFGQGFKVDLPFIFIEDFYHDEMLGFHGSNFGCIFFCNVLGRKSSTELPWSGYDAAILHEPGEDLLSGLVELTSSPVALDCSFDSPVDESASRSTLNSLHAHVAYVAKEMSLFEH